MRFALGVVLFIGVSLLLALSTFGLAYSDNITITAVVAPIRAIYVDSSHKIVKIESNTLGSVKPIVESIKRSNQAVVMNQSISNQYQYIMSHCLSGPKYGLIYDGKCTAKNKNGWLEAIAKTESVLELNHL